MKHIGLTTLILCICLTTVAWGQARRIVVEEITNDTPSFFVRVSVNHENREYREDDLLEVNVRSSRDGYLYLFYSDAQENVSLLFPNQFEKNNFIRKETDIQVPSPTQRFRLRTAAPFGVEKLLAVVTKEPLEQLKSMSLSRNVTSFSQNDLHQFCRAINVEEYSPEDWAEQLVMIHTYPATRPRPEPESRPEPEPQQKRFLVCVGVSRYEDGNIPPLLPCRGDVLAVNEYFTKHGVKSENTITLLDEQATMENVRELFCEILPSRVRPGDEVILFWSGHGNQCSDENGDEKDGKDETLVLYDSRRLKPETQLMDDTFGHWMQKLDGCRVLVILDACHSAGLASSKSLDDEEFAWDFGFNEASCMKDLGQRNMAIFASSTSSQPSLLRMENDMSVMTYFFLQKLNSQSGWTHSTLFEEIRPLVNEYVEKNFPFSKQNMEIQDDMSVPMKLN